MVLLAMTPAVVAAIKIYTKSREDSILQEGEPSLQDPVVGNPISHEQLIDISKWLKERSDEARDDGVEVSIHLSALLKGCAIYVPPPPPKAEKVCSMADTCIVRGLTCFQSDAYKALMARLRQEEEARQYERMLNPTPQTETFAQRYPTASYGHLFPPAPQQSENEDDDMTYADINRQMAMIANVLISIIACSIGVWKTAWHWDVPARLALSMVSSIVVALAEVAIYAGYIGRLQEARQNERMKVETKEVAESWVIQAKSGTAEKVKEMIDTIPKAI
jgi:hypothetical protein